MNVVFRTVDAERDSTQAANRAADVIVKPNLILIGDQRAPVFGRKDKVINQVRV